MHDSMVATRPAGVVVVAEGVIALPCYHAMHDSIALVATRPAGVVVGNT